MAEEIESRNQPERIEPYYPGAQQDIAQQQKFRGESGDVKAGTVPVESVVVSAYDARPINGYDFSNNGIADVKVPV